MKRYFLIDESTGRIMRLLTGENIIRRGAEIAVKGANVVCVGTTCINVSRTHAIIKLCENGEAWLRDCESTNGTFLHSDTGVSVRLEPGFFYQLKRGNHVTFGDLKLRFEWDVIAVCGGRVPVYDSNANLMDSSQGSGMNGASNDLLRLEGTVCSSICASCSLAGTDATPPMPVTLTAASDEKTCAVVSVQLDCGVLCKPLCELENVVPYLSESTGAGRKRSRSVIKNTTDRLSKVKSLPSSATVKSETTARGSRLNPKSKSKGRVKVCFSGMCGEATLAAKFLAKKHRWSIVDNVCMADLLIINHPPVRTPKFIIAVARGIPVVTEEFFACGDMRQVRQFAPSLVHNNCTYDAGRLFQVITSNVGKPALLGRRFSLEKVPPAWRRTARNILTGCGAVVFTKGTKRKSVISLTGATLTALYDDILRGKVPA
ncbi:hypothetical protein, conserved [Trypanosoma brucei gambiense DAL972]|uniref:FHA domain-containing protein n=1 Tax=Trypanosoma brucei gambiense (strain MHOM/CI/86/DAL972) TaxID=679716 RepID=C9ZLP5_TRYB9|nr:hypothetical protein, conserved [Trypanosoma brucei gambiense DAL972]CBH10320.1 hypothetical protein, conserved [Trypanosoma brucei gambiense DAL972]|eukprot:XP_011772610.1 hypothetical protein, conserved [Trypanosoma brucei gambiense DAL972]